jgi:hypothetical protein
MLPNGRNVVFWSGWIATATSRFIRIGRGSSTKMTLPARAKSFRGKNFPDPLRVCTFTLLARRLSGNHDPYHRAAGEDWAKQSSFRDDALPGPRGGSCSSPSRADAEMMLFDVNNNAKITRDNAVSDVIYVLTIHRATSQPSHLARLRSHRGDDLFDSNARCLR